LRERERKDRVRDKGESERERKKSNQCIEMISKKIWEVVGGLDFLIGSGA
jgi:hypothetical protein